MVTSAATGTIKAGTLALCLLASLIITPGRSNAEDVTDQAANVVRDLATDIWSSRNDIADDGDRKRYITKIIEASTDVDLLGRLVLGRHWRSLKPADRGEYQTLFSMVVIGGLAGRLDGLLHGLDGPLDRHFAVTTSAAAGKNDILVRSKVIPVEGQPLAVDWRLRDLENGPVIIDLVVEGVSLLVSQRSEFASVIERNRIEGLIEALRDRARTANF